MREYAPRHGALANVLAGSIAVQVIRIIQAYTLGLALSLPLPFTTYVAFVPIILLVMLLPITVLASAPASSRSRRCSPAPACRSAARWRCRSCSLVSAWSEICRAFLYASGTGQQPKAATG